MNHEYSLEEAFDYFRAQSNLSDNTLKAYGRAVQRFYGFLEQSSQAEPLSLSGTSPAERSLADLGAMPQDVNLLAWFANYLGKEAKSAKPRMRKGRRAARLESTRRRHESARAGQTR